MFQSIDTKLCQRRTRWRVYSTGIDTPVGSNSEYDGPIDFDMFFDQCSLHVRRHFRCRSAGY